MALTRDFKQTIQARVKRDPAFRKALLREAIENFLSGDVESGKTVLRDFINATVGFTKLGGHAPLTEEPDADAWPDGQSPRQQPV